MHIPVGVLAKSFPTWAWYLGPLCKVQWMASSADLPARQAGDPIWIPLEKHKVNLKDLPKVNIVLIQGEWDLVSPELWQKDQVHTMIRIEDVTSSRLTRGKGRGKINTARPQNIPADWKNGSVMVSHEKLGGVTTGKFKIEWVCRKNSPAPKFVFPPAIKANLRQVLSTSDPSGGPSAEPKLNQLNSSKGLLNWKQKWVPIVGPHLYRKNSWVTRMLSRKEKCDILDIPNVRSLKLSQEEMEKLVNHEIPGKVYFASVYFFTSLEQPASVETDSNRGSRDTSRKPEVVKGKSEVVRAQPNYEGIDLDTSDLLVEIDQLQGVSSKATKSDDALVPEDLWNVRIAEGLIRLWETEEGPWSQPINFQLSHDWFRFKWALKRLRRFALQIWKRLVRSDFDKWYREIGKHGLNPTQIFKDGLSACDKAERSSWWEWDEGSAIFFWRWPEDYQNQVRIGIPPMFEGRPPSNQSRQPPYDCQETQEMVKKKVMKVLNKGYIKRTNKESIKAFMFMFHVPKGDDDIRMVYDGSKSGLNDALFSPWFALPTVDTMARSLLPGTWLADNDFGEQFLNFPMHPQLMKFCGVDLSQLLPEERSGRDGMVTAVWMRSAMGLKSSPHNAVQGAQRAKRLIMGIPSDVSNPFHWDKVILNLPGSDCYDATKPWLFQIRKDGRIASDWSQYVDDVRLTAASEELAWQCSSKAAKGLAFLGLQDAARKRRKPSQTPGAWAGATVTTDGDAVRKGVTQERWEKLQNRIRWIGSQVGLKDEFSPTSFGDLDVKMNGLKRPKPTSLHYKTTESCIGFIVYVSLTYTSLVPYLKGIYLSLNAWRGGRDGEGWKLPESLMAETDDAAPENHPMWIDPVPRLKNDVEALMRLTQRKNPPLIPMRATNADAVYIVGDASGTGFGSTLWSKQRGEVKAEFGAWTPIVSDNFSSNFREATNLVQRLKNGLEDESIEKGSEVFIFTDNVTAERTMYKGSSSSKLLHNLVLDLRKMEMDGDLIVHFIWIAGKRMIQQGADGLSRGDFATGVMEGKNFLSYLPLNLGAFERHQPLREIVLGWCPGTWKYAETEDWFHEVFQHPEGKWIWAPPPAIARIAVEQACEAKHIFPKSMHIFICPALMTGVWRKQLLKLADTHVTFSCGSKVWPEEMYEPLTVAFVSPLLSSKPWKVGRTKTSKLDKWRNEVLSLSWTNPKALRNCVRKFWMPAKW